MIVRANQIVECAKILYQNVDQDRVPEILGQLCDGRTEITDWLCMKAWEELAQERR